MSQGPLCPNLSQTVQKEVSQIANRNFSIAMLLGGLSVNLNHLKRSMHVQARVQGDGEIKCKKFNAHTGARTG